MYAPDFEQFEKLAEQGNVVPVYRTLLSDTLTPVSAFSKLPPGEHAFLLESVVGGEKIARYSFLGAGPFALFQASRNHVVITVDGHARARDCDDPLAELEEHMRAYRAVHLPELPRFVAGAVGYAAYDAVRYTEHLPDAPEDDRGLADLLFGLYDSMVVFDHITKTVKVVVSARIGNDDLRETYERTCRRIDDLCRRLAEPTDLAPVDIRAAGEATPTFTSNFQPHEFEEVVDRCKEYIRAGDIFQVVISQRLATETGASPLDIYRTLRVVNPSPYMFFLRCGDFYLVGSSPEVMVRVEDREVTIRPLAGTRRRGKTEQEDQELADELLADPKERAEHIMLVDLGRNDVGRVADFRTVELTDLMTIERYSHVMHITSNVSGHLSEGKTAFDALRACVPAGTVSGAPKVRAMEIIDEIEPHRRGPYAGAVGYVDFAGNMDTCIALRTLVIQGQTAYAQAGAGIVADSVPEREYEETLNKARALLRAILIATEQLGTDRGET